MNISRLVPFNFAIPSRRFSGKAAPGLALFKLGLNGKILLIAVSVSLTGVLASSFFVLTLQRQQLIDSTETATMHLSNVIKTSLEHAMLINDRATAGRIVQSMVSQAGIERMRILDAQGVVQVSSIPMEVGGKFDRMQPACQFCHTSGAQPGNQTTTLKLEDGRKALLNVNLIRNKPECMACHAPQIEVLGLLMIEMPMSDLDSQLAAGFWRMVLAAAATLALLVLLMVVTLRRLVARPLGELVEAVAEIGAGNLDCPVRVASQDEMGKLAQSFDAMRQKLKHSRAEMERRNQELSMLNEVALAASQRLDLGQILDLALDTVVNRLGMRTGAIHMLDENAGRFTLRACRGLSEEQRQEIERLRQQPGGDFCQRVAESGEAVFVADMATDDLFRHTWDDLRGRSYVNVPLKSKGAVVGTMGLVTCAGQPLTEREVQVLKAVGNEIGIAIDNALLVAQTRRGEQQAMTLYQLGTQISNSLELSQVLDAVAEGARQILASDIGVVGLLDEGRKEVVVEAAAGTRTEALKGIRVPVREEAPGSALASGRPIVIEEYHPGMLVPHEVGLIGAEGIVSFVAVPLRRGGRLRGLVGAGTRHRRRFTEDDVHLLTLLSQHVAAASENARLYQQVRHLTVLEERDRLARELHDYLAQALGYLNFKASITDEHLSAGQISQAQSSLLEMKRVSQATYTDVREAIFSLHTAASSGLGLLPTLREYLAEYQALYGLETQLVVDDEKAARFSPEVDIQLLRIIQEALSNVRKHAQGSKAWVGFEQKGNNVCITVRDDGRGFDPAEVTGEGRRYFGLQIMRERAESVGGHLELDSRPGHGTRVVILMPRLQEGREL